MAEMPDMLFWVKVNPVLLFNSSKPALKVWNANYYNAFFAQNALCFFKRCSRFLKVLKDMVEDNQIKVARRKTAVFKQGFFNCFFSKRFFCLCCSYSAWLNPFNTVTAAFSQLKQDANAAANIQQFSARLE